MNDSTSTPQTINGKALAKKLADLDRVKPVAGVVARPVEDMMAAASPFTAVPTVHEAMMQDRAAALPEEIRDAERAAERKRRGDPEPVEKKSAFTVVNPYMRVFRGVFIDIYRVCSLWGVDKLPHSTSIVHAVKKLLRMGKGSKPMKQEVREAIESLERWLELMEEDEKDEEQQKQSALTRSAMEKLKGQFQP